MSRDVSTKHLEKGFVFLTILACCGNHAEDRLGAGKQVLSALAPTAQSAPLLRTTQDINVPPGSHVRVETFFKDHARELNLGPDDDFKPGVPQKGLSGFSSTRFQHIYRGLPVFGAEYVVTQTPAGDVSSGMGRIVAGLSLGASPTVSATNALAIAKDKLAKQLGFPAPSTFEVERQTLGYGAPRSVAFTDVSAYRLIYRIILASNSQGFHHQIDVDALTGDIAEIVSLSVH